VILVTGANGVVGKPLVDCLNQRETAFVSVSRKASAQQLGWDLEQAPSHAAMQQLKACQSLIHCAPIWLLAPQMPVLREVGIKRIVVFSSTSVISKQSSSNAHEKNLVSLLSEAEVSINDYGLTHDINITILRPSLIYGYGRDENVSRIARFIKKRGFMLLVGAAHGQRQPVHADDLVNAALAVLNNPRCYNKTYNLAGAEVLTYRVMVERIIDALDRSTRIISLPLWLFRAVLSAAAMVSKFDYTPDMADRMNQDLSYSNQAAIEDFGYCPQAFLTQPKRDLP